MKKICNFILSIVCFCILCGCNSNVANSQEINQKENTIPVFSENDNEIKLNKTIDYSNFKTISDIEEFIANKTNFFVSVDHYEADFYDFYEDKYLDEYGSILLKNEKGENLGYFYISFINNSIYNLTFTANCMGGYQFKDFETILIEVFNIYLYQHNMSKEQINTYIESLLDFEKYTLNIYNNPEIDIMVEDCYGLGVIFEGGKDFEMEGKSYYFSVNVPN